ncbi:uncharacterized protein [Rutidosis leptorrhynchoides]|uniref:uncharacterized protein n=1 Tax=Rutidosis leptorrhynchoides TaxID=125765 RepID=UPI003A99B9A7
MKILSLNIRGFAVEGKFGWVKSICYNEKPSIAVFQETKCHTLNDRWIQNLWGSNDCGFIQKEVRGNSGGLLVIWDTGCFEATEAACNDYFLVVRGKWKSSGQESVIVNVYGPHDDYRFNDFISRNNLIEIPISGKKFMRISDDGVKLSKLDRFLATDNFLHLWDDLSIVALDRRLSDHSPLILRDKFIDYGPKPFKVFDVWLDKDGVEKIIQDAWDVPIRFSRKDCNFRDRLKNVKSALKVWSASTFSSLDCEINELKRKAMEWELKAESSPLSDRDRGEWLDCRRKWIEKENIKANVLKQKARIRWILEGMKTLNSFTLPFEESIVSQI